MASGSLSDLTAALMSWHDMSCQPLHEACIIENSVSAQIIYLLLVQKQIALQGHCAAILLLSSQRRP